MHKKNYILLILISILVISGCSSNRSEGDKETTIEVWNRWGELRTFLEDEFIPKFEEEHENIKVKLEDYTGEGVLQTMQTAITGETFPDLFLAHPSLPLNELHDLDLFQPIDDIIGDYKEDYEDGMWTYGSTVMDDGIYAFPLMTNNKDALVMYYNKNVLKEAGIDESDVPQTWDELMDISKQVTEKTDAYGTLLQLNTWSVSLTIQQMASAISPEFQGNGLNLHTGEYVFETTGNIEAIEFLKSLIDEEVNHPIDNSLDPAGGAAIFADDQIAFYFDGPWGAKNLYDLGFNDDDFGASFIPTKNGDRQYLGDNGSVLKAGYFVPKNTKNYEEVKKFLTYFIEEGYTLMAKSAVATSPIPEINDEYMADSLEGNILAMQDDVFIYTPSPLLKNQNTAEVEKAMSGKGADKSLDDILNGYVTGQIKDLEKELKEMSDQENKAFEDALTKVQEKGLEVDKSDWQFTDWEPLKPYNK